MLRLDHASINKENSGVLQLKFTQKEVQRIKLKLKEEWLRYMRPLMGFCLQIIFADRRNFTAIETVICQGRHHGNVSFFYFLTYLQKLLASVICSRSYRSGGKRKTISLLIFHCYLAHIVNVLSFNPIPILSLKFSFIINLLFGKLLKFSFKERKTT